jgi:folylpolyglutamate synthase
MQKKFAKRWRELDLSAPNNTRVLCSVEAAVEYVRSLEVEQQDGNGVHAFVTGSVHLVGRALGILEGVDAL